MSIDLRKYQALKDQIEEAKSESSKAAGVLETLKAELKEEFGCMSIKDAKVLLADLIKKQGMAEEEFNGELKRFEAEFGDVLK